MLEQLGLIGTIRDEDLSPEEPETESEQEVSQSRTRTKHETDCCTTAAAGSTGLSEVRICLVLMKRIRLSDLRPAECSGTKSNSTATPIQACEGFGSGAVKTKNWTSRFRCVQEEQQLLWKRSVINHNPGSDEACWTKNTFNPRVWIKRF